MAERVVKPQDAEGSLHEFIRAGGEIALVVRGTGERSFAARRLDPVRRHNEHLAAVGTDGFENACPLGGGQLERLIHHDEVGEPRRHGEGVGLLPPNGHPVSVVAEGDQPAAKLVRHGHVLLDDQDLQARFFNQVFDGGGVVHAQKHGVSVAGFDGSKNRGSQGGRFRVLRWTGLREATCLKARRLRAETEEPAIGGGDEQPVIRRDHGVDGAGHVRESVGEAELSGTGPDRGADVRLANRAHAVLVADDVDAEIGEQAASAGFGGIL